ncbi:Hypothetical protein I595_370 [Croceitalea dokdonensis DOKDO 023]|uniref:Uncharacterized protein n=1 Tax=Croceitalea dokdonensis DOKDO 023 TaxID=1300341 RepID=A0A0P7AIP9_9FLAO|nr:Hypothetical protein I595_370 [Croceitalea dokdonensis DOKDO 023]
MNKINYVTLYPYPYVGFIRFQLLYHYPTFATNTNMYKP